MEVLMTNWSIGECRRDRQLALMAVVNSTSTGIRKP
jgi:hypothetical protein